jgi:hypothetical protein
MDRAGANDPGYGRVHGAAHLIHSVAEEGRRHGRHGLDQFDEGRLRIDVLGEGRVAEIVRGHAGRHLQRSMDRKRRHGADQQDRRCEPCRPTQVFPRHTPLQPVQRRG